MQRLTETTWRKQMALACGLFLITFLLFARAAQCEFVNYDDGDYVFTNPHVRSGLTWESVSWAFTSTTHAANWHPLTWLSLQLDYDLFGLDAGSFHLSNVFFHALNAALLFVVLQRLTGQLWPSAAVAALFGWHPLHVESVAWVAERKDVLSTLFWILTLWAYLRYVQKPGIWRYLLVALALALGLMAKPMVVTLPCVLVLLDYWPLGRLTGQGAFPKASPGKLMLEKVPLLALSVGSCALTAIAQHNGQAISSLDLVPFSERLANAVEVYVAYLAQTIWPDKLAALYPLSHPSWSDASVWLALGILAAITAASLILIRSRPYLAIGWFWYLGTLVPVIGLVQVGEQSMADRYTYVPLIGIFIMAAWGGADLAKRYRLSMPAVASGVAVVSIALMVLTWRQIGCWKNTMTLWEHALEVKVPSVQAYHAIGFALTEQNKYAEAIEWYSKALELNPKHEPTLTNRGVAYRKIKEYDKALADFTAAIAINPKSYMAHYNLGVLYSVMGQPDRAEPEYLTVIALNPYDSKPHANLARHYLDARNMPQAQYHFLEALKRAPSAPVLVGLAETYLWQGDMARAIEASEEAIRFDPKSAQAYQNLSIAHYRLRNIPQAFQEARQAFQLAPESQILYLFLAFLLHEGGDRVQAKKMYDEFSRRDPKWKQIFIDTARQLATNSDAARRCGPKALEFALQACQAAGEPTPEMLDVLAMALAETGQMKQAVETTRQALKKAQESSQHAELITRLQAHLQSYEKGEPIRQAPASK
jgi:tetratricopeptide (TPR) repeat protein